MTANGIPHVRDPGRTCPPDHRNASSASTSSALAASQEATERARKVMPLGVPSSLPGLRPASDRGPPGPRLVDGRRRRQPLHRFRHGLRRAVRRPLPSTGAPSDRPPARRRHAVRHAVRVRTPTSPRCSPRATTCRCGASPTRGTEATMDAIRVARVAHRSRQDRQGRGRLPRSSRRGDDLDEAAARAWPVPADAPMRHPGHGRASPRCARRHQIVPVQRRRALEQALRRSATWPASSSSRSWRTSASAFRSPATCEAVREITRRTARC